MASLREFMDRQRAALFDPGRPLERMRALFNMVDGALYTPGLATTGPPHVRDSMNRQRLSFIVLATLSPVVLWAMFNAGHQSALAAEAGTAARDTWQEHVFKTIGWGHDHASIMGCVLFGALFYLPVVFAAMTAAGLIEIVASLVRQRAARSEFLLDALLFSLVLPPATPLWLAVLGIGCGVLLASVPLAPGRRWNSPVVLGWFAVWIADPMFRELDTATFAERSHLREFWSSSFLTNETAAMGIAASLLCVLSAALLIAAGVRSGRIALGCVAGTLMLAAVQSLLRPGAAAPLWQSMVTGAFTFGAVFLISDPRTAARTNRGRLVSGFGYCALFAVMRAASFSNVEASMLSVLALDWISSGLDELVLHSNLRRRQARYAERS